MTKPTTHQDRITQQQQAHIERMTMQFDRFAQAISRLNNGMGMMNSTVKTCKEFSI